MGEIDPGKDHYSVLGVSAEATAETIRSAYRVLARKLHPDSGAGDPTRFREVQEAYEILRDADVRAAYDRQRKERGLGEESPLVVNLLQSRSFMYPLEVPQMLYVVVDFRYADDVAVSPRRLNLALVIDHSVSMKGPRIEQVKATALELLESLDPTDRLAVVTFSDRAEVIVPSDLAGRSREFRSAIAGIVLGGGTEIFKGLQAGLKQVRRFASEAAINHVLLLTDGQTYGDEELALKAAAAARAEGIGISAFGIGDDWNDTFLDRLCHEGGGTAHYIDTPTHVRTALLNQIQGLAGVAIREAVVQAHLAPYVTLQAAHRVVPTMESLEMSADGQLAIGDLIASTSSVVVVELQLLQTGIGQRRVARFEFRGVNAASGAPVRARADVVVTFTQDRVEEQVSARVLSYLGRLSVYQLQEKAWQAADAGDVVQATHYLESAATRLFDMGYRELGQAAMLEVGRLTQGSAPTLGGRKKLRYQTRSLAATVT